jgi:hypothetical protein
MDAGEQSTETEIMPGVVVTVTGADPDLVESCVEVAVIVAVPAAVGVKTPDELIVPPVAAQVTAELNAPLPCTVAVHWLACPIRMLVGAQETLTDVMLGDSGGVNAIDPPQPITNKWPKNKRTTRALRVMHVSSSQMTRGYWSSLNLARLARLLRMADDVCAEVNTLA